MRVLTGGAPLSSEDQGGWKHVGVSVKRWSFAPLADLRLILQTMREVLVEKPDSLHLVTLKPIVVAGMAAIVARALSGRDMSIVATVPGLGRLMSPGSTMRGRSANVARYLVGRAVSFMSRRRNVKFTFETVADYNMWVGKGLVPAQAAQVIGGAGVDPAVFYPGSSTREGGPLRVLFASRLLKSKGLDVFVRAAQMLRGSEGVEFIVAGMVEPDDPDAVSIVDLAKEPAIHFLGKRNDMGDLLRQVDVVCLPTRYGEGIPRILIEASATGIPSIVSEHEGCREIVEDGRTGVVVYDTVGERAAKGVAKAIASYRDDRDLLRRHGTAAREKFVHGDFAEQGVVKQFTDLLASNAR
ncbi:MAG: glycosyltransferase [Rhizobiaceae bacterium]